MKLHVGCGTKIKEGYKHLDLVKRKHIDFVCPVWEIPVANDSFEEIYSRHLFEHLTPKEADATLEEWYRVLQTNGIVHMLLPNLEFHCRQLSMTGLSEYFLKRNRKVTNFEHALKSIYGWLEKEDYSPYMKHNWGYTQESIAKLLAQYNFRDIFFDVSEPANLNVKARK